MQETDKDIFAKDAQDYLPVFNRYKIVLDHGEGAYLWDINGKKYLDFLGGIAVNVLGHDYGPLVTAISEQVDPIKLKLPVFGKLTTKVAVARFGRGLAMMLKAGVPLVQALDIVGEASNNWKIEQAVKAVQDSVKQGKSFSQPLEDSGVFPSIVVQMARVGEESGTLPDMLESIADFYDDEVATATEQLTSSIEPILIVGIGIIIGGMVVSLYLPIFTIYGEIANQ